MEINQVNSIFLLVKSVLTNLINSLYSNKVSKSKVRLKELNATYQRAQKMRIQLMIIVDQTLLKNIERSKKKCLQS